MIDFEIKRLHSDRERKPAQPHELLLWVVADLEIKVGDQQVYFEPLFPVVELANALLLWKMKALDSRKNFEFESMESDEVGLIWIRKDYCGWRIGSIHQICPVVSPVGGGTIDSSIDRFVEKILYEISAKLHLDVSIVDGLIVLA